MLLCHKYKLLLTVIARRLHLNRDYVCTVNMILREDKEAMITFIDYKAAFYTESQLYLDNGFSSAGVKALENRQIIYNFI